MIAAMRRRPEWSKVPDIYLDIVDNPTINAGAKFDQRTGCGYIGIFAGSILCIEDLFNRIWSHPNFASEIGDCRVEAIQSFHADGIIREYEASDQLRTNADLATTSPKDPLRRSMASALSQLAFDYLVRHEIAHIIRGHDGYLRANGVDNCLEFDSSRAAAIRIPTIILQCTELQADNFATNEQVNAIAHAFREINVAHELQRFIFAVGMLFLLLEEKVDYGILDNDPHPLSTCRLNIVFIETGMILKNCFPESHSEKFLPLLNAMLSQMDDACFKIGAGHLIQTISKTIDPQKEQDWQKKIRDQMRALPPEVNKDAFVKLRIVGSTPPLADAWDKPDNNPRATPVRVRCQYCQTEFDSAFALPPNVSPNSIIMQGNLQNCPSCHRMTPINFGSGRRYGPDGNIESL